jgi:hypothetical protein
MINSNQLGLTKNIFKSFGYVLATGAGTCFISLGGTKPVVGAHLSFTNFSNLVEQKAESLQWLEGLKFEDSQNLKFETSLTKNRILSETLLSTKTPVEDVQIFRRYTVKKTNAELTPNKTGEGKLVGSTSLTYPETISESEVYSNSIVEPLDSLLSDGSGMTNLPSFSRSQIEPIRNTKIANTTKEPEKIAGDLPISTVPKVTQTSSSTITSNQKSGSEPTGKTLGMTNDKQTSEDSSLQPEIVASSEDTTSVELSSTFIQKLFNIIAIVSGGVILIVLIIMDYRRNHC